MAVVAVVAVVAGVAVAVPTRWPALAGRSSEGAGAITLAVVRALAW